ncbi:ATP-binding protein [Gracilibacillus sp. S3-1-1]|uniref:ATP-binding protein n=1 Tax=Gracilibacillus pellucidus TaxID=3095368 RepID=A0ACC6M5P7_9BACI|nr:ATP-binding protein [Gracilibacillus sp. S3-1-1]MDX8046203.1 ATP-binding protein [Gracilibacillus sp. S3-1-1]
MKELGTELYVHNSKWVCRTLYQLNPKEIPFLKKKWSKQELHIQQQRYKKELHVVQHFMKKLIQHMAGIPTLIITTDYQGYILDIYGDDSIREMIDSCNIKLGAKFDEKDVGTNSVSLSLEHQKPFAIIGTEHYHEYLSEVACYSTPIDFTNKGSLIGTVSIMTTVNFASNFHLGLLSSAVDTIEREIQLQEQNHTLHLLNQILIDSTPIGLIMTDQCGRMIEFNSSAESILELSKQSVIDNPTRLSTISEYIHYVLETGEIIENLELSFAPLKSDYDKRLLLDVLPLFDEREMIGAFAQFRDMTSYHDLQQQLINSEKLSAIGKLGAGLAHELRNPLTSIIGLTHLMKEQTGSNQYLPVIINELDRMKNLVNQFVAYGKPSKMQRGECNLSQLVHDTIDLMRNNACERNIKIHFEPENTTPVVHIDKNKIKQVLINFIKNACEAMPNGGNIKVKFDDNVENSMIRISIKDEGVGMTNEQLEQLGTLFFTTKETGLGMGLPICIDIIHSHDGKIEFDSEVGKGTEVHIFLPLYQERMDIL